MARQGILAIVVGLGIATTAMAQQQSPSNRAPSWNELMASRTAAEPTYKYQVTPQAGPWLVCVQTFKGPEAQRLAEELATVLNRDFKIPAYLHDSGRKQREEEKARVDKLRDQYREAYEQMEKQGLYTIDRMRRWRVPEVNIEDEFAVLVGKSSRQLKDMEAARDYLNDIRKLKNLPKQFSFKVLFESDKPGKPAEVFINPFITAMVVHNPTVPFEKQQDDPAKADKFIRELNAEEEFSVLKCRKDWTLVVKLYQGPLSLQAPQGPAMPPKFNASRKDGDPYLNACAIQAHATADFLRKSMKMDAYVMHHRSYSIVTVGQYDKSDDAQLLANQKTLAGLQLKSADGRVLESFNAQPLPMRIPK